MLHWAAAHPPLFYVMTVGYCGGSCVSVLYKVACAHPRYTAR